jgi:tetratricopeptide (TPR) repeat protein
VDFSGTIEPAEGVTAIELAGGSGVAYRADVDSSGYFRVNGIPEGEYRGRVAGPYGNRVEIVYIEVFHAMPLLVVRLPEARREAGNPGTISMAMLQHTIPGNARKEMDMALHAVKKNDEAGAVDHLRKALELDPEYMEAHNSLGIRYVTTGRSDLAVEEFQKALEMDPRNAIVHANLAAAYLGLKRGADAERAARRSVELNGASTRAHFVLGLSLLEQGKATPEAEMHLKAGC